jgi:hypothetical protein
MPETIFDLGKKVKAKYPGQYDDLADDEVGRRIKTKHPGAYDDFTDAPAVVGMEKLGGSAPGPAKPPKITPEPYHILSEDKPPTLNPNPTTLPERARNFLIGPGRDKTFKLPIASSAGEQVQKAVDAPMTAAGGAPFDPKQPNVYSPPRSAKAASDVIRGVGTVVAAGAVPSIVRAPFQAAKGIVAGTAGEVVGHGGAKFLGASDDAADLAGDLTGFGAGAVAVRSGPRTVAEAKTAIQKKLAPEPRAAMVKAIKPLSTNIGFKPSLDRSMPELRATEVEMGKRIENLPDLLDAIQLSKKRVWGQYGDLAAKSGAGDARVDLSPVADAIEATISPKLLLENPKAAKSIIALAKRYRAAVPFQQAESMLKTTNAELDGYYAKYPTGQRKALAGNPEIAVKEAQATKLRDIVYTALDSAGEGAAPRELKQRYGALMNLEKEVYRRQNVAERQQPDSLSEQVGKWSAVGQAAKGGMRLLTGDLGGAADIASAVAQRKAATWLKEQQTTDALIRSAFQNYGRTPTPVNPGPRRRPDLDTPEPLR